MEMFITIFKKVQFFWIYLFCITFYTTISYKVFKSINNHQGLVVDELFHVPQGLLFCKGNFSYYDPKITTPPGLYWISALILSPFQLCSTYWLRLFNFVLGIINIELVRRLCTSTEHPAGWTTLQCKIYEIISAFVICTLPPMYFFNNVYYTDTLSTTSVLCIYLAAKNKYHVTSIVLGAVSVLIRQTNIIWLSVVYGETLTTIILQVLLTPRSKERISKTTFKLKPDIINALRRLTTFKVPLHLIKLNEIFTCVIYIGLIQMFLAFVYFNGGIVLGDKSAHQLSIHIPQLFYFGLFVLVFLAPYFIDEIKPFLNQVFNHKLIFLVTLILTLGCIHFNTHVHPYMLADNRHYTFYLWKRFLSVPILRYGLSFVYIFVWFGIYKKLSRFTSFQYIFVYTCGIFLTLGFQKLIDVRYFFLPYIALRIRINNYKKFQLALEFLISLIVNVLSFYVYSTKQFYWKDWDYPQRIIW